MKKYLGNAAVKGVIASAMTALLVVTAPVNVTAADAAAVIEFTDITDAAQENILDKDTVENKIEEALKDTDLIKKWEEKLQDKEDYYYKKFSSMETALSKLNSQTSSLSGLFGG